MQLLELQLPDYRGLGDFRLDLTQARDVAVLVGRNASGKSRLLHAIVEIFGSLRRGRPTDFPYWISYVRGENVVEVRQRRGGSRTTMRAGKAGSATAAVPRAGWERHLPDHVFGYQAARESHWDSEFLRHAGNTRAPLLLRSHLPETGQMAPAEAPELPPLFQCELAHLPLILLALLPQWSEKYGPYVERTAGITGFAGADLTISRPRWAHGARYSSQPYWGLGGNFPLLFDQLASSGRYGPIPDVITPSTYDDFRIAVRTPEDLDALLGLFETDLAMFATFEYLMATGALVADVQLIKADGARLTSGDLSSGEQQMLTVLGMLRLQRGRESLFLLDEPASHFHPGWSQYWYSSTREMLEDGQRSQFIASTHDPALVSNIPRERIRLFRKDGDRITAETPDVDPRGRGIGGQLTTELWGLETQLDKRTQELIDEQHELAGYPELDDVDQQRLRQVNEELDQLDFATERRDPVVALFLSELARRRRQLIEAAGSGAPVPAAEFEALVSQLFDERFSQGL